MAIKIGSISISLTAETASFQEGMSKASQIALNSSRNIERSFAVMGTAITAATGAAIGALGLLIEKTEDTVFAMQKMAAQSGTSIEAFSKMAYAAKTAGMPIDQMAVILTRISHTAFEAASGNKQMASAYKQLGVSVQDSNGHFKTADQIAVDLAKSLNQYSDSAAKTGIETTLMGRSGAQAAEFLDVLANRFDETSATAQKLGVVFSEETAQGAVKLHDSLIMIEEAGLGLSVRLLSSVSPALDQLAQKIVGIVSNADNMKRIDAFGEDLAKGIRLAGDALQFMVDHLTAMKVIIGGLATIRLAGMFGPMIVSAVQAEGTMSKLGLAVMNLTGNLLGVRKLGTVLAPLIADAAGYTGALISLAREEGAAATASMALGDALAFAQTKMALVTGALGLITLGVGIFTTALIQNKSEAEQSAGMAVTWSDMWHGAIDNVKEDFQDLGKIIHAIMTGDFSSLTQMKWTSLPDAAANEAKKRAQLNKWGTTLTPDPSSPEGKKHKKDMGALPQEAKPDQLAKRLEELRQKAEAAQRALALVGSTPQQQRDSEILEKYNMFLAEEKDRLDKLSPAKRALAEADAHASITTEVNTEAATKYATELYELTQTVQNTTQEHLAMAAAVGHSAKAMQDAAVAAQVNQKYQKMGGPNWQSNPQFSKDASTYGASLRQQMNAENQEADNKAITSQQRQLDSQNALNAAILRGSDAKREATIISQQAAVRQDFAGRGDTNTKAMQDQIDMVRKKSDADKEAADLERASSMDVAQRFKEQKQDIQDAVIAAEQYGKAIDFREVLQANKDAWMQFNEAQDKAMLATGSMMDGLKVAMGQIARDTESNAQLMYNAVNQAIGSLNEALVKIMMMSRIHQPHAVRDAFGGAVKDIGQSLAKTGLQKAESGILGGFGAGKPDGSSNNPWYVRLAGGAGSKIAGLSGLGGGGYTNELGDAIPGKGPGSSSSVGNTTSSIVGSLLKMLPAFADGGDVIPGMPSIVGERGPELFLPAGGGSIVPNSKLKDGLSGDTHYHIDARGSSDPAQTVALIHQYMTKAAPQIANGTMKAMHERTARTAPSAARR